MQRSAAVGLHQVLPSASPGDAITDLALGTRELLRRVCPSEIYACHIAPELVDDVLPLDRYRPAHSRNVLIVHASIGQAQVHEFLTSRTEPLVLVYHNITPGRFFDPYDRVFADLLDVGRREVERLLPRVVCAIADSHYNARELEVMGYRDVRVVPPVMDLRRLSGQAPSESTAKYLANIEGPILLSVGQIMPHKRPDFLVQVMHIAATYLRIDGALLLVGHQRLPKYTLALREQLRELNLSNVHIVGPVEEPELVAMFQAADAVVTASEHEGFCLPLLEAMAFGQPIVARAFAAIPETVGDAALLLPPDKGPIFYAEAIAEMLSNAPFRDGLVSAGRSRIEELERRPPSVDFVESILEVV